MEMELIPAVAKMTRGEIERRGIAFVSDVFPELLEVPGRLDVFELLERLRETRRVEYVVTADLEPGVEAEVKPWGDIHIHERTYDLARKEDPRARATIVHEAGHVVLHAHQIEQSIRHRTVPLFRRGQLHREFDPEWQADVFCVAVAMPRPSVGQLIDWYGPQQTLPFAPRFYGMPPVTAAKRVMEVLKTKQKEPTLSRRLSWINGN